MVNPTSSQLTTTKRVFKYLKGTTNMNLIYEKGKKILNIIGYRDNDFSLDIEDKKSNIGQELFLDGLLIT